MNTIKAIAIIAGLTAAVGCWATSNQQTEPEQETNSYQFICKCPHASPFTNVLSKYPEQALTVLSDHSKLVDNIKLDIRLVVQKLSNMENVDAPEQFVKQAVGQLIGAFAAQFMKAAPNMSIINQLFTCNNKEEETTLLKNSNITASHLLSLQLGDDAEDDAFFRVLADIKPNIPSEHSDVEFTYKSEHK